MISVGLLIATIFVALAMTVFKAANAPGVTLAQNTTGNMTSNMTDTNQTGSVSKVQVHDIT